MSVSNVFVVQQKSSRSNFTTYDSLVGESHPMLEVKETISRMARSGSNVLITGETGTGKELVAELIHQYSSRCDEQLVCVNCAAIPDSLLESELFGHEKGCFTGATQSRDGRFKQAHRGSLLLDEIGEMTLQGQAKILRAIESNQIQPVGGSQSVDIDVRIIAATNQAIESQVVQNQFREDLFYRLNVARLQLPPLRARRGDLELLCNHFIHILNHRFGQVVVGVSDNALDLLSQYHWPGNVRQLKNVLEASFINEPGSWIQVDDLPKWFHQVLMPCYQDSYTIEDEKHSLLEALRACDGNKSRAARLLNWSRMTLYRKIQKHNIDYDKP